MFPLDFPLQQMTKYSDARRVLDPFCGRGTTLYAARLAGRSAVGIDVNPVAGAIAQAKLARVGPSSVVRLARDLIREYGDASVPKGDFWDWAFHDQTLRELAALREGLLRWQDTATSVMLRALILGVLHGPRNKGLPSYLSNQMPRTYASKPAYAVRFWRERDLRPVHIDPVEVVARRAERMLRNLPPRTGGRVLLGDAATTVARLRRRFDLVVTSPPYYGMRTYVPDQWLRNWFLGGPPNVPYGTEGQLATKRSQAAFVSAMAEVWRAVAERCSPGAHLVVRFGALPSAGVSPEKMLLASLTEAGAGWLVRDVRPAGAAIGSRRQAEQFNRKQRMGPAVGDIDVTAELIRRQRVGNSATSRRG
ncbi:site-specific DNA-methyltransferase [Herbidospora sp. NEAU-GS84]|uniref:site-specific DNA-methyltransferase (cytosine-N(4)-specific) n=2 Tax=Herbidospora solisilvae TaxID=2696284 RepID=A0A7C9J1L5_9ACTN|nr:site-specific DNA-methyltransferase [Herbidospora solisilvae]